MEVRKVNVPYFWPYFLGIFPLTLAEEIGLIYGRYLQFRILEWPLNYDSLWSFDIPMEKHHV